MSSVYVRETIKQFLADNSSEDVVDLTAQFADLRNLLFQENIQPDAPWLGLDFAAEDETPISLTANNTQGLYREYGLISLHVCAMARIGAGTGLVSRGEVLQNLFRGERIEDIVIERVVPINTGPGATLEFEAGYVSGTILVYYYYDKKLG